MIPDLDNSTVAKNLQRSGSVPNVVPWLILLLSLCVLYVTTFIDLFKGIWKTDQQAHGPIVLAIALWFLYYKSQLVFREEISRKASPVAGWTIMGVGLLLFVVGRSQSILVFEVGSLIFVLLAMVLIFFGRTYAKRLWFAFFFMLFVIPIPGSIVDSVTLPMKLLVSYGAEHILYWLGYPIARIGVLLNIGQYQLLVADACSGLNSLFTLEVLGLLYLNVMKHESPVRNVLLALVIVPVSFTANTIRVVSLALITFYYGDAAGQGFLHQFSSLVLFVTALLLIMGIDSLLRTASRALNKRRERC